MIALRFAAASALMGLLAAGCGGGSAVPPAPNAPGSATSNALTTYSVFVAPSNGDNVVDVVPLGQTSSLPGAQPATAGNVLYPDGSVQSLNARGNFDASQSVWTATNLDALIVNPLMQPLVDVAAVTGASGAPPIPEELAVSAYAPGGQLVAAADIVQGLSPFEIASMSVFPKSVWLADGRSRLYTAVGKDASGGIVMMNKQQIVWTISRAAGCGTASGTISAIPSDGSRAIYHAPASGSTTANCPDLISATFTSGGTQYVAAGAAYSYDPKTALKLAGVLNDATGKPVAKAIIDLYASGSDADQGTLLATTDAKGYFSRSIPASRTIAPVAAVANAGKTAYYNLVPATLNPVTSGASLAKQVWALGSLTQAKKSQQADFASIVRDAAYDSSVMREKLPLDVPDTTGTFAAGSIEAILAAPKANATGSVTAGQFRGFTFAWDAAATKLTLSGGTGIEAPSFVISSNAATVGSQACPSGAKCFAYVQHVGAALVTDGAWSQLVAQGSYGVTFVRNIYNAQHQNAGSPVYTETIAASRTLASGATLAYTVTRTDAAKRTIGTVNVNRTDAAAPTLFTYNGTMKALTYRANGSTIQSTFALSNGVQNDDGSGQFGFTVSASPSAANVGATISWNAASRATAAATGIRASGTIDVPYQKNLTSGHIASFTVDTKNLVKIALDASIGGGSIAFQL